MPRVVSLERHGRNVVEATFLFGRVLPCPRSCRTTRVESQRQGVCYVARFRVVIILSVRISVSLSFRLLVSLAVCLREWPVESSISPS